MAENHLHLFGGVWLTGDEFEIRNFVTTRAAKLLVILSLTQSGQMPRTQLADQLWPDDFYDSTRLRLRQEIHRLKRALGPASEIIGSDAKDVWINKSLVTTDLDVLQSGSLEVSDCQLLDEFLPGWDDFWVTAERIRAEQLQVSAAIAMGARRLESGDAGGALALAKKLVEQHPLNEEIRMVAVNAHAKLGSIAASVAEYQDYRRQVRDRLGVEPGAPEENFVADLVASASERKQTDWSSTLPTPIDPILGREPLVEDALSKIAHPGTRLLTFVGPGGIGKTRLAIEVAARLNESSNTRVAFVSFADVADPTEWARAVLSQLRSDPPTESDPQKYLGAVLSEVPTILVMDNLESVLPAAADGIRALLNFAPQLKLIATSVFPSKVKGEFLVPVGPLDPGTSGVELLAAAVQSIRPQLLEQPNVQEDLLEIARRLDGYPLAIRLASARLRLLSPRALLDQLHELLGSPGRGDLAERHRSIEVALASTFGVLTPSQRNVLERLAVYPGGLSMDLAALEFDGEPYLEQIEELLDLALINLDDHASPVRIQVLSSVRHHVLSAETKSALEANAVQRILEFVAQFQLAPWSPLRLRDLAALDPESDNIAFAFRWSCENEPKWAFRAAPGVMRYEVARGRASILVDQLDSLSKLWDGEPPDLVAEMELCRAHLTFAFHQEEQALPHLQKASQLAEGGTDLLKARVAVAFALYSHRKDLARVQEVATDALALSQKANDRYLVARCQKILAAVANAHDKTDVTRDYLRQSYEGLLATESDAEAATTGTYLSHQLWHAGKPQEAALILERCRKTLELARDPATLAYLNEIEGRFAIDEGRPVDAEASFRESLRIWTTIGSAFQEADQNHSLTRALIDQERWLDAKETLVNAADLWFKDDNRGGLCCSIIYASALAFHLGDAEESRKILAFAIAFEKDQELLLMKGDLDFRAVLLDKIGPLSANELPTTMEVAHSLFNFLR